MVPGTTEEETFAHMTARLKGIYGQTRSSEQVDAAVTAALDHFSGTRLRAFVPVLAERRARATLEVPTA